MPKEKEHCYMCRCICKKDCNLDTCECPGHYATHEEYVKDKLNHTLNKLFVAGGGKQKVVELLVEFINENYEPRK